MASTNRDLIVHMLKATRSKLTPAQRKRTRVRQTRFYVAAQYPWAIERFYASYIKSILKPLVDYTEDYLVKQHAPVLRGDDLDWKMDATPGRAFDLLWATLNGWVATHFKDDSPDMKTRPTVVLLGLGRIADRVLQFARTTWGKSMKASLGFEFPANENWWPKARDRWAQENLTLIRSLATSYIQRVNTLTEQAIRQGVSWKNLYQDIKSTGANITDARARLIARDQVGKLNGAINQHQMVDAGLDTYIWRTLGDERVRGRPGGVYKNSRPSHWLMEGLLCRWDDASVYSADGGKTWVPRPGGAARMHPGEDIQCRCTGLANWKELVGEADAQLGDDLEAA